MLAEAAHALRSIPPLLPPEPPAVPQMPAGTLGYAVARCDPYGLTVLTHTSLMPADEARREADAQRQADGRGYGWAVVEVRRA
jgi:hypothetical protein